jgi:tRNA A-37 threonylcarbamoyl transferase component Bud32
MPDRVLDYVAQRLTGEERDAVERHVDACGACRELLAGVARSGIAELATASAEGPDHVGRYQIIARHGEGGMGAVYEAHDPQLDRRIALKLVHPDLAARGGLERLVREGRALARLAHPNIVAVHDAGTDGGRVYIAMELVEGKALADWLESAPRTWREIVAMFVGVGRGLAAAHRAGIVHRDIKPRNVLVGNDGVAKVVDFGRGGGADRVGDLRPRPSRDRALPGRSRAPACGDRQVRRRVARARTRARAAMVEPRLDG